MDWIQDSLSAPLPTSVAVVSLAVFARFVLQLKFGFEARRCLAGGSFAPKVNNTNDSDNNSSSNSNKEIVKKRSIKILTQNVWAHYFVAAPNKIARLNLLLEHIAANDYDVVCVQELFIAKFFGLAFFSEVQHFREKMMQLGFNYHTDPCASCAPWSLWPFPFQNSGLMTFSKLRIVSSREQVFDRTAEILNNKGMQIVRIVVDDNTTLSVINTHFDSRKQHTTAQIAQVGEALRALPDDEVGVACGDFNVDSMQPNARFAELEAACGLDAVARDLPRLPTFRKKPRNGTLMLQQLTFGALARPRWPSSAESFADRSMPQLDHLFVSPPSSVSVTDTRLIDIKGTPATQLVPCSDHFGVAATINF